MRKLFVSLVAFCLIGMTVFASPAVIVDKYTNDDAGVTEGALDVNVKTFTSGDVTTLLSAVTETGASEAQDVSAYSAKTFQITSSSVSTGATVLVQTSLDGTNWVTLHTESITANGNTEIAVNGFKHKYIRANVTSYTDGTYTVTMIAGN